MAHTNISAGDLQGLLEALRKLGITDEGVEKLEKDMEAEPTAVGPRIKGWLSNIGSYLGKEALKAGVDVAKKFATRWILQKYGFDLG